MPKPKRILGDPFKTPKPKKKPRQRVRDGKLPLWERVPAEKPRGGFKMWADEKRRAQTTDDSNA